MNCIQKLYLIVILALSFGTMPPTYSGERKSVDEKVRQELLTVLRANEDLHTAFFYYQKKAITSTALELKKAIDQITSPEISNLLKFSSTTLSKINDDNNREINNQNYNLVSMALIHIINKYDLGEQYNAYYCPMEKKRWIQNSKKMLEVLNPYAPQMAHCGTKETNY